MTCIAIKGTSVNVVRELPSQPTFAPLPSCNEQPKVLGTKAKRKHHAKRRHHAKRHYRGHRRHHAQRTRR